MHQPILLIDDDENILFILQRWLVDAGFTNVVNASRKADIDAALQKQWALIITDVFMPQIDGLELCQKIKHTAAASRVLVMTGTVSTDVTLRALESQVDGFLPKPISRDRFLANVKDNLKRQQQQSGKLPRQKILAIGAHPDDVEIGCGGILLSHRDQGDDICILTLSGGACGGNQQTRIKESEAAAARLNANLVMENFADTCITEGLPDY